VLVGKGCEHLSELKKLALSYDASLLEDFPEDLVQIAKRLVKNWWTKHGLLFCIQKIEEENWVSFITIFFGNNVWQSTLAQPEADKNSEGEGAGGGDVITGHDASSGASAIGMTGNNAETKVPAAEAFVTKDPKANAVENPEGIEIPHTSEV
jgi:hypothetical protein